jgi:glycosyltransferase involved in cell wall biosynthesis
MEMPLISIITPSYNRVGMITEAVESVLAQDDPNCEHLIVDGASADGTLDLLARYPHLRVVSEPDRGMYDAINKGLRLARGEIIGLLNTDDRLAPGCLAAVRAAFAAHPGALAAVGSLQYEQGGRLLRTRPAPDLDRFLTLAGRNAVNFPNGWFLRRAAYERVGEFDASYRITADNELMIRLALAGVRPLRLEVPVYIFKLHADSLTLNPVDSRDPGRGRTLMRLYDELMRVPETHLPRKDVPPELRRSLRWCVARNGYRLAATALYHRRWDVALQAARRSLRYQPLWPFFVFYYAGRRALQYLFPAVFKPVN